MSDKKTAPDLFKPGAAICITVFLERVFCVITTDYYNKQ
jgi:hypothetical protein